MEIIPSRYTHRVGLPRTHLCYVSTTPLPGRPGRIIADVSRRAEPCHQRLGRCRARGSYAPIALKNSYAATSVCLEDARNSVAEAALRTHYNLFPEERRSGACRRHPMVAPNYAAAIAALPSNAWHPQKSSAPRLQMHSLIAPATRIAPAQPPGQNKLHTPSTCPRMSGGVPAARCLAFPPSATDSLNLASSAWGFRCAPARAKFQP